MTAATGEFKLIMRVIALSLLLSLQAFAQEKTVNEVTPSVQAVAPAASPSAAPSPTPGGTPEPTTNTEAEKSADSTFVAKMNNEFDKTFPKFSFKSYGYFTFSQAETFKAVNDLTKYNRRKMDLAEIAFEGNYELTPTSKIEFEVEIEHGGVGTAMEFDPFEEFGEFETEVEKGGEVALPEFVYKKTFPITGSALKVGKFPLFISLGTVLEKPGRFPAILSSDVEAAMIPYHWNELGVQAEQKLWMFTGRLGMVSGLNSEFFRSYSWVGGGYQRQFENVNADDLATVASLEFGSVAKGTGVGLAYYNGNTQNNRYKKDKLTVSAEVEIWSLMVNYRIWKFQLTGESLRGTLENSDKVALANSTLGGLAKPKSFAPLGHKAVLDSVQLAFDIFDDNTLVPYARWEHVNTFEEVQGSISVYPRYDWTRQSAGIMWAWDQGAFMKFQYAEDKTELVGMPDTKWFGLAFGFDIAKFN
ncbi:hypothetical protein B9G69_005760 [Bdellovibrio sp. SKB1291214]|uniref:hypothetical protein n=1 Tax=Bdellovibrio sp. SKB1291214 TaxID=1732569 RepID=UPI0020CB9A4D|nr:hypothetical protein [Bdellovibrio sp. SKB1291214]UYL10082.1 hypothetical protein B9G69_005760 [Bdellovibrio sp. SKB1291214]